MTQATTKDYWISPSALHIELNALSDPDYIQASCISGAQILVYIKDVIGYDAGHNYRRWPLQAAPTVFNTHTEKYVYAAIPRDMTLAASAWIVFPSELLDIYGKNEKKEQIGDEKYYYIFLQGIITSSGDNGATERDWKIGGRIMYGTLSSDEAISAIGSDTEWYNYSDHDGIVTFLKNLTMNLETRFRQFFAEIITVLPEGKIAFGKQGEQGELNGIASNSSTELNSVDKIVTPNYLDSKALSKVHEDVAQDVLTFLKGIKTAGIENYGDNITQGVTELYKAISSHGFKDSMTAGSGWQIDKDGNAQVESIEVRSYMRVLELVMNRLSAEESEFIFTESGTVETATLNEEDGSYTLTMRKKTDKDITPFQKGDILKGVVNDLTKDGAVGVNYYTSWMLVTEEPKGNSITVAVYADDKTPAKQNFPPCELMVLHRWGNADETKKERQSCWYISSIEKRIVMMDGVTQPITTDENLASFYGLPFDMETFKGYSLNKNQPYLYVRGAFLQDVCFIDYLGKVVKQERYRGVWSQEVANSDDPYIVKQTTFDTVYHKNAKWQCNSTEGTKEEPSVGTTDWTMLTDGGKAITVDSTDVYYCISSSGKDVPNDNYEGWTNAIVPTPTKENPYLWTRTRWYFSDGTITPTYTVVRNGKDGRNIAKVFNFYKWGTSGFDAPSGDYSKDTIPPHLDGSDYLWNYEECRDENEGLISQSGKTCIGYFPKDGEPGKGIASITEYYQIGTERKPAAISISTDGTTVTIPSGWNTTIGTTTPDKRYVWNQEVIKYSNGTYSVTAVHLAGAQGENGADGADGALPNLFGYDTKVECLVGHHNVVHTKTGFALVLDSISDDDTSSDRYCLLRIKNITAGEGTYSISGYITHGRGGKFEFDCGDVTPQTMYLTANKRTRFEKKFVLPKNSYKHVDFEFFAGGYIVNVEELKIERTDNVVSECTPFVTLAHDSITQKQNILLDTNFQKTNDRTIWSVFNGDIVENAYNGLPAFHYKDSRSASVTTAVEILSQKFVGKLKPSTWYTLSMFTKVKGKVIPYIGSNVTRNEKQTGKNKGLDAVVCDEYIVSSSNTTNTHQLEESTEYKRHSITFLTAPDLTNADERMYFYVWAQAEIYVTMLKLEECEKPTDWQLNESDRKGEKGKEGKNGKPLVGPTEWNASAWYMSGKADNEPYQSIVINPKNPKQMYLCGYSHSGKEPLAETSTSSVDTCTEDKPWVQVPYQDFVATKVLFAERGKIENLDITNATIQGTITDMAVKTKAEWDAITNALVPKNDKEYVESKRNFQIVDPSKAGSYFIPTFDPRSRELNTQIVFLPTYNPSTDYDIITCNTTLSKVKKRYNIPKYQIAGTHIRITKGGAPLQYSRWAYLEDAEYDRLWTSDNTINRETIRDIYNMGTLICADHKIFKVTDGNGKHGHNITGAWYYGDSDYKHGRLSVNGTVARMLWLMPGQTVELVSQIEEINNTKCLVWSVVNASDFTAVNINADVDRKRDSNNDPNFDNLRPIEFHGESGILAPDLAGNADNWEDCFIAHKKIDKLLLNGETKTIPSLFINRNSPTKEDDYPIAEFYIP